MRFRRWQEFLIIACITVGTSVYAQDYSDMVRLLRTIQFLNTPGPHCDYPFPKSPVKSDDAACDAHFAVWQSAMAKAEPVDSMLEKLKAKSPQILLIGEDHYASAANYYPTLIHKLKAAMPDLDCLFVEFSPQSKMNVQAMQAGRNDLVRDARIFEEKSVIDAAASNGIKIVFSDRNSRTPGWEWIQGMWIDVNGMFNADLEGRNHGFVASIQSQLDGKSCQKGALIVGKSHITEQTGRHYKTLPQLLKEKKIKTAAITMINTGDGFFGHLDQFSWADCQKNPTPPRDAVAFTIEGPMSEREDSRVFGGRMGDFDFAIVAPPVPYKAHTPPGYQQR